MMILLSYSSYGQSPHGSSFKVDCKACHSPNGWEISDKIVSFNHDTTGFVLDGQHAQIDCKSCHTTLVFNNTTSECITCHADVHNMSVGNDCARCHTTSNWLIDNIPELHEQNGFPLFGAHDLVSCVECHIGSNNLQWSRLGGECADCHTEDYNATTNPNHAESGFSLMCLDCHLPTENTWVGENFHYFFPLTGGHAINDCMTCHSATDYFGLSSECISCHQSDYDATSNPNHLTSGFNTACTLCHGTGPGWTPASFKDHDDDYFPIYSGEHRGEWRSCYDCHVVEGDYSIFSCIDCHEHSKSRTDREHGGMRRYRYESSACFDCHPRGHE